MTSEQPLNHCSELRCPANMDGQCAINSCLLVDPFTAIKQLNHKRAERGLGPIPEEYAHHFAHHGTLELRTTESFRKHPELEPR